MLDFHPISLRDREAALPFLYRAPTFGTEYNFCTLFFWPQYFGEICITDTFVTQMNRHGDALWYLFPACIGDVRGALEAILADCRERGGHLRLYGVSEQTEKILDDLFSGKFVCTRIRNAADYIYSLPAMCTLQGRKLQSKRNFCNRFEKEHPGWHTEPVTGQNLSLCRTIYENWETRHEIGRGMQGEQQALSICFDYFEQLGMEGLLLFDGDEPLAFTIGSRTQPQAFDVHFEKAPADVPGAYPMICREFSRYLAQKYPDLLYLNREDDVGEENLRRAKLAYHPAFLLEKYVADYQEDTP